MRNLSPLEAGRHFKLIPLEMLYYLSFSGYVTLPTGIAFKCQSTGTFTRYVRNDPNPSFSLMAALSRGVIVMVIPTVWPGSYSYDIRIRSVLNGRLIPVLMRWMLGVGYGKR